MKRYVAKPPIFEAVQFMGTNEQEIVDVLHEKKGYTWLPMNEAGQPDGTRGLFKNEEGSIVLREDPQEVPIDLTDWILFHDNGGLGILTDEVFRDGYEEML